MRQSPKHGAIAGGFMISGRGWVKVDATIVECFRAWDEPRSVAHPLFEIVADITTGTGDVERVTSHQKLSGRTHFWRSPDPGDVVPARWNPTQRELRLDLGGDPRYDEKVIKALGRTQDARPPFGTLGGSA